jgi:hypothetical protein
MAGPLEAERSSPHVAKASAGSNVAANSGRIGAFVTSAPWMKRVAIPTGTRSGAALSWWYCQDVPNACLTCTFDFT